MIMSENPLPMEIGVREVKSLLDQQADFLFVDCREPEEHKLTHIAGAMLVPMKELATRIGELQPARGRRVVVHCHHGGRSLQVANWLRGQGFAQAQSMKGGIDQWSTDVDPAVPRY